MIDQSPDLSRDLELSDQDVSAKEISFERVKEPEVLAQIEIVEEIVEQKPSNTIQEEIVEEMPSFNIQEEI